jgi:imidazolonepropionase-like amidohydrolase
MVSMRWLFPTFAVASLAAALLPGCSGRAPDGVVLVGGTLIDGRGGPPRPGMTIVVRDGKIVAVGAAGTVDIPKQLPQVDVSGRWIMPGFIDAHAHLARWTLPHYLAWGVTTVRDMHGTLDSALALRDEVRTGRTLGPRIYAAGAMIDGLPTTYPDAIAANRPTDARKGVDRLVNAGADVIKVYTRADRPLLAAVIDEARTFMLPVAAHLGLTDAVTAARAGVRSIEHLSGVPEAAMADPSSLYAAHYRGFFAGLTAFERQWAALDSAALTRVARELAERKVFIVPTLVLHETLSRLNDPGMLEDSMLRTVPAEQREAWDVPGMVQRAGWGDGEFAAFRRSRPAQDLFVRTFAAAGGRIVTGTDAANQLLVPGYSEHRELELLVAAGLAPRAALLAATRDAAAALGADSLGVIAPGHVADLVVLMKNPLDDIRHTRTVERVMVGGRLLSADSIRASF